MTAPSKRSLWIIAGLLALLAVLLYRYFGLGKLLTLDSLKASRDTLAALYAERPLFSVSRSARPKWRYSTTATTASKPATIQRLRLEGAVIATPRR